MTRFFLAALAFACAVSPTFAMGHMNLPAEYPPSSSYANAAILGSVGAILFMVAAVFSKHARATAVMACLSMMLLSGVAFAQGATPSATTVEFSAAPWIALLREILLTAVVPVVAGYVIQALRRTYPMVGLFFTQRRVEQLGNAVTEFGINAIPGAVKEGKVSVNVGSAVIAKAVQYGIDNAPAKAMEAAGGPQGLAKIVFRKLNLVDEANETNVLAPILSTLPKK